MLELFTKLLFLYLPFQFALNPTKGVDLASIRIIIPLLFIAWLVNSLKNKKLILPDTLTFFLLSSFLFLACFSLFFAANPAWGMRKLLFLLSIFPLFFVIFDQFSTNQAKTLSLLEYAVWGAVGAASVALIQFLLQFIIPLNQLYSIWAIIIVPFLGDAFSQAVLTNPSWLVNVEGHTLLRATAFFPDPHMLSFYLNITGLISLGIFSTDKKKNFKYFIFFLILILASFLTFSRGGYLGLISGLLFFGFFNFKSKLKYFLKNSGRLFLTTLISLTLILIIIIPNPITNRFISSFDLSEGSNAGRIQTWKQSLAVTQDNFLLGVGLGNYSLSIKPSANYREPIYSHNTFLDIAAETGLSNSILWLLLFLFAIINFTRRFIRYTNFVQLGLAAALIAFSVHSLFETAIFSVHILPLVILILSLNNSKISTLSTLYSREDADRQKGFKNEHGYNIQSNLY